MKKQIALFVAVLGAVVFFSVSAYALNETEFDEIVSDYPELNLGDYADANIIELKDSTYNAESLRNAVAQAASTVADDVIVLETTTGANIISLGTNPLEVDIDSETYGDISFVTKGEKTAVIRSDITAVLDVKSGTVNLGGVTLMGINVINPEADATINEAVLTAEGATVNECLSNHTLFNLNGYYSIEFLIPGTGDEWMFVTGLSEPQLEYMSNKLLTFGQNGELVDELFIDAEKIYQDDIQMCWAATSANMLTYTGWAEATGVDFDSMYDYTDEETGKEVDFNGEDAVFRYFIDNFSDAGGAAVYGNEWFIDGNYSPTGWDVWSQISENSTHNGFFPYLKYTGYQNYVRTSNEVLPSVLLSLKNSCGVGLTIGWGKINQKGTDYDRYGGHMTTVWGLTYHKSLADDDTAKFTSIIISDSDDNKISTDDIASIPNKYVRHKLYWIEEIERYSMNDYMEDYLGVVEAITGLSPFSAIEDLSTVVNTVGEPNICDGKTSFIEAVRYASYLGTSVTFDPSMDGATIPTSYITVNSGDFIIDASALENGITLVPTYEDDCFSIEENASLTMKKISLSCGEVDKHETSVLYNKGTLNLEDCAIYGIKDESTIFYNEGTANLTRVIFSNNTTDDDEEIFNYGVINSYGLIVTDNVSNEIGGISNFWGATFNVYGTIYVCDNKKIDLEDDEPYDETEVPSDFVIYGNSVLNICSDLTENARISVSFRSDIEHGKTVANVGDGVSIGENVFVFSKEADEKDYVIGQVGNEMQALRTYTVSYYLDGEPLESVRWIKGTTPEVYVFDVNGAYIYSGWYEENATEEYVFAPIESDISLYATSTLKTSAVTVTCNDDTMGTVTSEKETYNYGEPINISISANDGYEPETVTINGIDRTADVINGILTLTADGNEFEIAVSFKAIEPVGDDDDDTADDDDDTADDDDDTADDDDDSADDDDDTADDDDDGKENPDTGVVLTIIPALALAGILAVTKKRS